jgi:hypothetical protein
MILTYLPSSGIPLAQRANTFWRAIILTSPKLQHALFMQPATTQRVMFAQHHSSENCSRRFNGQNLTGNMLKFRPNSSKQEWRCTSEKKDQRPSRVAHVPEAYWRKTLFSQPPVEYIEADHSDAFHLYRLTAEDRDGIISLTDLRQVDCGFPWLDRECQGFG